MKIYIPSRLRAALIAALSVSSFTLLTTAHTTCAAEVNENPAIPTLTQLNADDPTTYPNKSAYQLVQVTDKEPAGDFNIFKYLYDSDTGSYKAVQYNVVFKETLGDEMPAGAEYTYYKWVEETNPDSGIKHLALKPATKDDADLKTYSIDNNRFVSISSSTDVNRSFFGVSSSDDDGGAIEHRSSSTFDITGNFIGNFALSSSSATGGAIHLTRTLGHITGDFIGNYTSSESEAGGGAIYNAFGSISSITGDFIDNSALSAGAGRGGAIRNFASTIASLTGDFIGNSVQGSHSVYGGAIYNENDSASIGFLALDSSMQFSGNYVSTNGGKTKRYEAVYNFSGTLNFNAYDKNSIVLNDGIGGVNRAKDNSIININNGRDGTNAEIAAGGKDFSTVAFNSFVDNQTITVHAGELHLGKFTGIGKEGDANYIPSTQAELNNSSLTINAGALVSVQGQLELDSTSSISSSAEGVANGMSSIKGLAADSSISGSSITIADNSKMKIANITLTNIAINKGSNNAELTLQGVTLGAGVTSNSALSLTNSTLVLSSSDAPTLTSTRTINAADYSYYTLTSNVLISEVTGSLTLNIKLADTSLLGVGGLFGILLTDTDGISQSEIAAMSSVNVIINGHNYSGRVEGWSIQNAGLFVLIPEPSTATMSLLALAGLLARRRRKVA